MNCKTRILAWILSIIMIVTMIPVQTLSVHAEELDTQSETDLEIVTDEAADAAEEVNEGPDAAMESAVETITDTDVIESEIITDETVEQTDAQAASEELDVEAAWASDVPEATENVELKTTEWDEETEKIENETVSEITEELAVTKDAMYAQAADAADTESHQILLLLDVSGSMAGTAMTEMKKACNNFVDEILAEDPNAGIAVVTFASNVNVNTFSGSYFTSKRSLLRSLINGLSASGGTAMNEGMKKADEIMQAEGTADRRYIITMADGLPNEGDSYSGSGARFPGHGYESAVYNTFSSIQSEYEMYSLGFFHSMSGSSKVFAGEFMESIQNKVYFEVTDADLISFTFEEIALDINSDKLIMSQSTMSLVNGKTGRLSVKFTDAYTDPDRTIIWGTNNQNVAAVDDNGVVTAVGEGTCIISAEAGGNIVTCDVTVTPAPEKLTTKLFVVYKNKKSAADDDNEYVLAEGASVTYEGNSVLTNKEGEASIKNVKSSGTISVSAADYRTQTLDVSSMGDTVEVYLEKETDSPIINAVTVGDTNVLVDEVAISMVSKEVTSFTADVDWGKSSAGSIKLVQESASVEFSGNSLSVVLADKGFDVSKTIYILAKNADGKSTRKKLQIEADAALDGLSGIKFSLGRKNFSVTCPDDWFIIGGQSFSFDFKKFYDIPIPVNVSMDDGKVIVSGGIDAAKVSKTTTTKYYKSGKKKSSETTKKGLYYEIKEALSQKDEDTAKKYVKSLKQKYKEAIKKPSIEFGISGDVTVMFYVEGYVDSAGKFQFTEGKVCVSPSLGVSWDGQFAIGPVPCYWEAAIKGQIDAMLALWRSQETMEFQPSGSLALTITGNAGAGVGVNKVFTVGGGAQVQVKPSVTFYKSKDPYATLYLALNGYFKLKAFALEYRHDFDPIDHTFELAGSASKSAASSAKMSNVFLEELYNSRAYVQPDSSYLEDSEMEVVSADAAMAVNEEQSEQYAEVLQTLHANSYDDTQPSIVSLSGNTKLAVWIDSAGSDINQLYVYYSYYDGTSWSPPKAVDEDGTPDSMPSVCAVNNRAYIVWQNAERALTAEDDLDKIASSLGIKAAEYRPASDSFTVQEISKDSGCLDMMPVVQSAGDYVVAGWVENTANKWFDTGKNNTIKTSVWDGTSWSSAQDIVTSAASVNSLAVDYIDDTVYAVYACDTDGNLETVGDLELFVNGVQATDNDVVDSAAVIQDHTVYWYSGAKLMTSPVGETLSSKDLFGNDLEIPTDQFKVIADNGHRAVVFTAAEKSARELYGVFEQASGWGYPVRLTARNNAINQFDGIWENDQLLFIGHEVKVNDPDADPAEDNYGQSDLIIMSYSTPASVTLDDLAYDDYAVLPGSTLPISVDLTNNSMQTVNGVLVEMLDASGNVVDSMTVNETILSGDSATIEYGYLVKDADIGKTYIIRCSAANGAHETSADNTAKVDLSYEDLNLTDTGWGLTDDGKIVVNGTLQNLGFNEQKDIKVVLSEVPAAETDDNMEGVDLSSKTEVASYTIDSLASLEQTMINFTIPAEYSKLYYLEAICDGENGSTGNNASYIYIKETLASASDRNRTGLNVTKKKTVYTVGSKLNLSDITATLTFDDGNETDVTSDVNVDASGVDMSNAGSYFLKVSYESYEKDIVITVKDPNKTSGGSSSGSSQGTGGSTNTQTANAGGTAGKTAAAGDTTKVNGIWYEITSANGSRTVKVQKPSDRNLKKASITGTVTIQNEVYTVSEIGNDAFKDCTKLKSISLPAELTKIGDNAFSGCTALKKITIPKKVTKIGKKAFYNTEKLKKVTIKTTKLKKSSVGSKAFSNAGSSNYKKLTVKVPKKKLKAYKKILKKKGLSSKAKVK